LIIRPWRYRRKAHSSFPAQVALRRGGAARPKCISRVCLPRTLDFSTDRQCQFSCKLAASSVPLASSSLAERLRGHHAHARPGHVPGILITACFDGRCKNPPAAGINQICAAARPRLTRSSRMATVSRGQLLKGSRVAERAPRQREDPLADTTFPSPWTNLSGR